MRMFKGPDCSRLLIAIALVLCSAQLCLAQSFSAEQLQRDMQNVAKLTKKFYRSKNALPTDPASCDQLLYELYKKSREYDPNQPLPFPTSSGAYRELGRFRIAFDLGINQDSNTLIVWRKNPPDSWIGKGGTIGILTNGDKKFLLYGIGESGRPITSPNGLTIFDVYDCETGEDDERIL